MYVRGNLHPSNGRIPVMIYRQPVRSEAASGPTDLWDMRSETGEQSISAPSVMKRFANSRQPEEEIRDFSNEIGTCFYLILLFRYIIECFQKQEKSFSYRMKPCYYYLVLIFHTAKA